MDKQRLDEAWAKMRERLKQEPDSANWASFSDKLRQANSSDAERTPIEKQPLRSTDSLLFAPSKSRDTPKRSFAQWLHRRRRWIAGTAAFLLLGSALATPAGNRVLASLLNEFRMEQLAPVKENELDRLFDSIGLSERTMNQYGEFSRASDGPYETYTSIEELRANAGGELVVPELFSHAEPETLQLGIAPTRTLSMKIKVDNINFALRQMGVDYRLPESVDGKKITLTLPESVRIERTDPGVRSSYLFLQRPVPSVSADAGIPLAEAMDAFLNFPLIPSDLKQELLQSRVLDGGSAPLPIVMPEGYERIRIANTEALLAGPNEQNGRLTAIWVKRGTMYLFGGPFRDREELIAQVTELIGK